MTHCPKCGGEMGMRDVRCPHCGYAFDSIPNSISGRRSGFAYSSLASFILALGTVVVALGAIMSVIAVFVVGVLAIASPRIDLFDWLRTLAGALVNAVVLIVLLRVGDLQSRD